MSGSGARDGRSGFHPAGSRAARLPGVGLSGARPPLGPGASPPPPGACPAAARAPAAPRGSLPRDAPHWPAGSAGETGGFHGGARGAGPLRSPVCPPSCAGVGAARGDGGRLAARGGSARRRAAAQRRIPELRSGRSDRLLPLPPPGLERASSSWARSFSSRVSRWGGGDVCLAGALCALGERQPGATLEDRRQSTGRRGGVSRGSSREGSGQEVLPQQPTREPRFPQWQRQDAWVPGTGLARGGEPAWLALEAPPEPCEREGGWEAARWCWQRSPLGSLCLDAALRRLSPRRCPDRPLPGGAYKAGEGSGRGRGASNAKVASSGPDGSPRAGQGAGAAWQASHSSGPQKLTAPPLPPPRFVSFTGVQHNPMHSCLRRSKSHCVNGPYSWESVHVGLHP